MGKAIGMENGSVNPAHRYSKNFPIDPLEHDQARSESTIKVHSPQHNYVRPRGRQEHKGDRGAQAAPQE